MKQVLQSIRDGKLSVAEIPAPAVMGGQVLIANATSLVSAGTEKMVQDLAKKSLLGKARERPDQVRRVLEKVRREGFFKTLGQVRQKLDEPLTMGYSSAGVVLACGAGVHEFKPGDRVASNGCHAEIVSVPRLLCARVPDQVSLEQASFAVIGSIALQGVRLSRIHLGETVLVIGLGLVGQLVVALLKRSGCRVFGTDPDLSKCELAIQLGAELARPSVSASDVSQWTGGLGADAVIVAAATKSNGPIDLAAHAVRAKGRVVLVGVVGLELDRRPFYFKEAEFVVSCSYGPGRYDAAYEEQGHDYPAGHVRWTEQRNIQAVLDLMGRGELDVAPLISHRFPIEQAEDAYRLIERGDQPYLGIVLTYPEASTAAVQRRVAIVHPRRAGAAGGAGRRYAVLGAGNFARLVLLPALARCPGLVPATISSAKGISAVQTARSVGFETATTDEEQVFGDPSIDLIFSLTRHDQHARHVVQAIQAGKHLFVEKPLCLTADELLEIDDALARAGSEAPLLMVGFNRRFAAASGLAKQFFKGWSGPMTVSIRFNAGDIPADHWTQRDEIGGGRIIGEACHAIDLATFLTGSVPVRVHAESISAPGTQMVTDDQCFITLRHANGSVSSIGYLAGGDKSFPKERIEIFGGGRVAVIDDFRSVTTSQGGKARTTRMAQDKGHQAEVQQWAQAVAAGGPSPISWDELRAVSLASILAVRSMREGQPQTLGMEPS